VSHAQKEVHVRSGTVSCAVAFTILGVFIPAALPDHGGLQAQVPRRLIEVSDVGQLYAAVNDAGNGGSRIVLAPGDYVLDASYPNGGRLELQPDIDLQGEPGHPEMVVIDASGLPAGSFLIPPFRTGAIRMGRGSNTIEWLTVRGSANAAAAIETDLVFARAARVRIAHVIAEGSQRGVDIRNLGPASAGRMLEADLMNNTFVGNVIGEGQGLRIINTNGATGAVIRAFLHGNDAHDNLVGCQADNLNTSFASISIQSTADRFDSNGVGCALHAGGSLSAATRADGNLLTFEAIGGSIQDNVGVLPPISPPAGVYATGALTVTGDRASNNTLHVTLWGTQISRNQGPDINVWGARSFDATPAGTNNMVTIVLRGVSGKATVAATPSAPLEPTGTNSVTIRP
jgi:hypothetical protein